MNLSPQSLRLLALFFVSLLLPSLSPAQAQPADGERILQALTDANDRLVEKTLAESGAPGARVSLRNSAGMLMSFGSAFANPRSKFHRASALIPHMDRLLDQLASAQNPEGLWDSGNIASPPDSAFSLKILAKVQLLLLRDDHPSSADVRIRLKALILKTADGVCEGGVHTPNHRWAICTALAHVHTLYPDPRYVARVDEWLAEGVDVDEDGQWSERSSNYTSEVNNPSMIDLAVLLGRPELLEPVRRSLDASLYLFEPNGEVETVASRRQDQRAGSRRFVWEYYFAYRYMAIRDANGTYAAIARWIERDFLDEIGNAATHMSSPLSCMLLYPELTRDLPAVQPLPEAYAKTFPKTALARFKRGSYTATLFGGSDWHAGLGHGSGLSTNPTFFKLRKGAAILESVRMSPVFFSTGHFYSQGLNVQGDRYVLSQELRVPYHLPLPKEHRRANGQYRLQADMATEGLLGRYFSKMDFAHRPKQFIALTSTVVVVEREKGFELQFNVEGPPGVPVTIELGFRAGGTFTGVAPRTETTTRGELDPGRNRGGPLSSADLANTFLLKEGHATYRVAGDEIRFGPGSYQRPPSRMEGESLTWLGGALRADGDRVYLTGITPFKHTLSFE